MSEIAAEYLAYYLRLFRNYIPIFISGCLDMAMSGSQLGECKPTQDQSAVATSMQLKYLWNLFIESTLLISLKNAFNRVSMVSSL